MEKIQRSEVMDLVQYEKVREPMRARVIELKKDRRIQVGDNLTLLFENRDTVLFQIQEMVRTERIVEPSRIQDELDAYNTLIPGPGELSATLFIEIPELARLSNEQVRQAVNRFQGLERDHVRLELGERFSLPGRFEAGHSKEEKMAAVQYLRFPVPSEAAAVLANPAQRTRVVVDHPRYQAEQEMPAALRTELLADLRA